MNRTVLALFVALCFLGPVLAQSEIQGNQDQAKAIYVDDNGVFEFNGISGQLPWVPQSTDQASFPRQGDDTSPASAPVLSKIQVYHVLSNTASEAVSDGTYSTSYDHDGPSLYIYTYEIGYGQGHYATLDYGNVPQIDSAYIVNNSNEIIGWVRLWDASAYGDQQDYQFFRISATSINCCGTQSDTLRIR